MTDGECPRLAARWVKPPSGSLAATWSCYCDYCKYDHTHGAPMDAADADNGTEWGHRVAHCECEASPYRETGYIIVKGRTDEG